jgi:hypothetical protein
MPLSHRECLTRRIIREQWDIERLQNELKEAEVRLSSHPFMDTIHVTIETLKIGILHRSNGNIDLFQP